MQRRAIVAVIETHHKDLDVNSLAFDLKDMGIFTTEQCQKLTCLDEKDRRHEAFLYSLLVHEEPDMYHRLVKCIGQRNASIDPFKNCVTNRHRYCARTELLAKSVGIYV